MARATVTLKEGATYRWGDYTFTSTPSYLSNPTDIEAVEQIGVLHVVVEKDAPIPPPPVVTDSEGTAAKIKAALLRKKDSES